MVITGNYSTSTNHVVQHLVECASSVLSSSIPNLWSLVWSNTLKERLINIPSFALMLSKSKANGEGFEVYQQQRIHREAETARRQSESVDYHICRKYGRWSPQHSICFELWVPGGSIHGHPVPGTVFLSRRRCCVLLGRWSCIVLEPHLTVPWWISSGLWRPIRQCIRWLQQFHSFSPKK